MRMAPGKLTSFIIILVLSIAFGYGPVAGAAPDISIYGDSLGAGWENWSWDSTVNMAASSPVHGGNKSIAVTYNAGWAGLYLHAASAIDLSSYERITFWIHGGTAGGQKLRIVGDGDDANTVSVTAKAGTWVQVDVPLSSLGSPGTLSDLYWQDVTGGSQPTFYIDDITLVAGSGPPPGQGPLLSIDVSSGRNPISADIYGMNYADEQLAAALRLPVRRWGGNSTTRYNWQIDVSNVGSDWYFENIPEDTPDSTKLPDGSAADLFVEQDRRTSTKTIITVPLIGWTPSRRVGSHPYDCGFKVSKYGAQQSVDPWDTDCGNGHHTDGSAITGNAASDTSKAIVPDFVSAWVRHLTGKYGSGVSGGVAYYNLDNEPMLWNSTHRDVHPSPVTYDEMRNRTYQYAAAVKGVDPTAKTLGPVLWGWCAYFYSAADGCGIGNDYKSHGNTPFVPWYLQQMKAYETQHGTRILDYLDLHYYPQANGVALSSAGNSTTQALRLRSTRSLWDSSYIDESWISDTEPGGVAVALIPRMKAWTTSNYPGTKLAITEYNWGALDHINGALAQADVLGIFGREGVDIATLWGPPESTEPGAFAFRIYRNYDGKGSGFGDVGVQATSADQAILSIYGAERTSDKALTLVIVNKTAQVLTSTVNLAGFTSAGTASAYRYSTAESGAIERLTDLQVGASGFTATFAARSITLFELKPAGTTTKRFSAVKTGTGSGTLSTTTAGITCTTTGCTGSVKTSSTVAVTATPATGSSFAGWTGCTSVSGTTCTVTMTADKSVSAMFTLSKTLTITKTGSGTVTSSPSGINCGSTCSASYLSGATVTLTATPAKGYGFAYWAGGCGGAAVRCKVVMNSDTTVTALFDPLTSKRYNLTVTKKKVSSGNGTITSSDGTINCGSVCSRAYYHDTPVTLTATPAANSLFTGWSGACAGTGTCTITMNQAKAVSATFTGPQRLIVTRQKLNKGDGTVTSSPAGIDCGKTCQTTVPLNTVIALNAAAAGKSVFAGWSGGCSGTGGCTVTMAGSKAVQATFVGPYTLKVVKTSRKKGSGTVTSTPSGINCGTLCTASYPANTEVTLQAIPAADSTFTGWTPATPCPGTGTCKVTMGAAKTVGAIFTGTGTGTSAGE